MVVETVFPGSRDSRSTISTRLFLLAKNVKEKARTLKSSLDADIMVNGKPDAILVMTFRQVVLHSFWSFELAVFAAGSWRNMDELANARLILPTFSMSSSDGEVLSMLAEVESLCRMVIEKIKETLSWPGDVTFKPDVGVWIGELPAFLKDANLSSTEVVSCVNDAQKPIPTSGDISDQTTKSDAQVLIYDESGSDTSVNLSRCCQLSGCLITEGNVVGFMPMSRAAVNYWATNRVAKMLYKWKKLSPSIFEPGLKIQRPDKAISLEPLMSTNGEWSFAVRMVSASESERTDEVG